MSFQKHLILKFVCIIWQLSLFFFFFKCACPVEKVQSCNSSAIWAYLPQDLSHFSKNSPHLSGTRWLPAVVQSEGSRDTHIYTLSHSYSHTSACAHPDIRTNLYSHFVQTETPCSLWFKPQNPRYIHLRHDVRSYFTQKQNCVFANVSLLLRLSL